MVREIIVHIVYIQSAEKFYFCCVFMHRNNLYIVVATSRACCILYMYMPGSHMVYIPHILQFSNTYIYKFYTGNGPSSIFLSLLLSGYTSYYNGSHPNHYLAAKLRDNQEKSLLDQVSSSCVLWLCIASCVHC